LRCHLKTTVISVSWEPSSMCRVYCRSPQGGAGGRRLPSYSRVGVFGLDHICADSRCGRTCRSDDAPPLCRRSAHDRGTIMETNRSRHAGPRSVLLSPSGMIVLPGGPLTRRRPHRQSQPHPRNVLPTTSPHR
jgi:hypothetical protein